MTLAGAAERIDWVSRVELRQAVSSTNDELRELAARGARAGTVIVADSQTAGRGRRGRGWHSPSGLGLYLSALFRNVGPAETLTRWTLAASPPLRGTLRENRP